MISSQPFLLCIWCCAKRMNAAAARPKGIGPAPVTPPREQTWTSPAANQIKRERPPSLVTDVNLHGKPLPCRPVCCCPAWRARPLHRRLQRGRTCAEMAPSKHTSHVRPERLAAMAAHTATVALESRGIDSPGAEAPSTKERGGVRAGAGPQAAPVPASVLLPSMACAPAP